MCRRSIKLINLIFRDSTPFLIDIAYRWCNSLLSLSAGLIFLFYVVFYIFLAGLFTLTMYVMLQTLDDHKPTWQDRLATPGAVTNETNCVNTGHGPCHRVLNSLLSLCHPQAWWLDPKQMRPLRLSMTPRKLRAGTCTLRPWTSSWHVSLTLIQTQKAYCCGSSCGLE